MSEKDFFIILESNGPSYGIPSKLKTKPFLNTKGYINVKGMGRLVVNLENTSRQCPPFWKFWKTLGLFHSPEKFADFHPVF